MVWVTPSAYVLRNAGIAYGMWRVAPSISSFVGTSISHRHSNPSAQLPRRISSGTRKVFAATGAKKKDVVFECSECGHQSIRDGGQCPGCGEWGSLQRRERTTPGAGGGAGIRVSMEFDNRGPDNTSYSLSQNRGGWTASSGTAKSLKSIKEQHGTATRRMSLLGRTGMEVSRVLGGGVVMGSLTLVGGDPGIGKSTLLLQVAGMMSKSEVNGQRGLAEEAQAKRQVLYVSAEESAEQIYERAVRLELEELDHLSILTETRLDSIIKEISNLRPCAVILDSIQAVYLSEANGSAGSLSQIRECCTALVHVAKGSGIPIFIVGHVTKDGNLAGPKALEHIVDVVLYMEGERHQFYRILRGLKNRFGATDEIGVFEMDEKGMHAVVNPSAMFLRDRGADPQGVGSSVAVTVNGTRPLLLEVQALCTSVASQQKEARLYNVGVDGQRLLLVRGVLEKYASLRMYSINLHVNVVGGLVLKDPAGDLAVAVAIASSYLDQPVPSDVALVGEVGLGGELRSVVHLEKRLSEVRKLGFKKCIIPKLTRERPLPSSDKLNVVQCSSLYQALQEVIGAGPLKHAAASKRRRKKMSPPPGMTGDGGTMEDE